jgi:2-keto-4-pentenoate hydratase
MERKAIEQAARTLWTAWRENRRIRELAQDCRPVNRQDGYRVQSEFARQSGQKVFGWKIAATSSAGQKHIGVDGPLAGRLLSTRVFASGDTVPFTNNMMKVAEAEFAFRMARDLPPRNTLYSMQEVLDAVDTLHPAIEIPDSRYDDFVRVGAAQLIADNACASYFVLGAAVSANWRALDLAASRVTAIVNGRTLRDGSGANVLGDPRIALTWIANELSAIDECLRTGQVVTTGTCIVPVDVGAGDHVFADFGPLGSVEATLAR